MSNILFYTIADPYNLSTFGVPIGKKPTPGNHEFYFKNLKVSLNVVSSKFHNVFYSARRLDLESRSV